MFFKKIPPSPFIASVLEDLAAGKHNRIRHDHSSYITSGWRKDRPEWHIWETGKVWRDDKEILTTKAERRIVAKAWKLAVKIAKIERQAEQMKLRD